MADQAATTAPVPAAKSAFHAPAAAAVATPAAQTLWDVQKLMEVDARKQELSNMRSLCLQVLSIDRGAAIELLKRNKNSVDAAISAHLGAFK